MQPLAKQQIFPPSWPVLTFGQRDSEENRCLKPCTLITYLVTAPISLLGQLNELPVKRRTSAFICTLPSVYFGIKPRFFNITWHELQLGRKWSRLKTWNFPSATTLRNLTCEDCVTVIICHHLFCHAKFRSQSPKVTCYHSSKQTQVDL